MNDNTSFERYVAEAFDREGPGRPVPDAIHDDLITRAGRQRQWPTWLASVKEPPMRLTNSNAVGSPTMRVLATMLATLLLIAAMAAAGIAGRNLLAADGTIVVDPQGNGDFTTITEGVDAAEDGDTVLLKVGTYPESVLVTKAITIRGEEPGTATIQVAVGCITPEGWWEPECPPEMPTCCGDDAGVYGIALVDADATVRDVHFHFHALANAVVVDGGSASLVGLTASTEPDVGLTMNFSGGSRVSIEDSDLGGAWLIPEEDSHLTIENSVFDALFANPPADSEPYIVRNNRIGAHIYLTGPIVIEGNEFPGRAEGWESDSQIVADGGDGWVIRNNTLSGADSATGAISVSGFAGSGIVKGNIITDSWLGILLSSDKDIEATGNDVTGGHTGIQVNGGAPRLVDNTVEGASEFGLLLTRSAPTLNGNRFCGNNTDLYIGGNSEPVIGDDNEICVTRQPE